MNAFAVKPPKKQILLFTISSHQWSCIAKIEAIKNKSWSQLLFEGYKIVELQINYYEKL